MGLFSRAGLYVVTSQSLSRGRTTLEIASASLRAGVRLFQLREKELPTREFVKLAKVIRAMTQDAGALLIINDRLDVALASGADGVHLGLDDLPVVEARRIAPDLIIGASCHSVEEALASERMGASYVNIGPIFPTGTKAWDRAFLGIDAVRIIGPCLRVPFTVMGGIKKEHIASLIQAGARTIAVVTAVTTADDPEAAARELLNEIRSSLARFA